MTRPRDQTSVTQWAPTLPTLSFCDEQTSAWATDIERPDVVELVGVYARFVWELAAFKLGWTVPLPQGADE